MPTKDQSVSFPVRLSNSVKDVFGNTGGSSTITRISTATRTRTGSSLPKWKEIIADGGNATTGMDAIWDTVNSEQITWSLDYTNPDGSGYMHVQGDPGLCDTDITRTPKQPTMDISDADNAARARFYKALRKQQVAFSGPTFLGELRETMHMLRRPASALWSKNLGYLDALGKAKRASPKHWTKSISGLWLEFSFGWTPLINDVKDAAKAYSTLVNDKRGKVLSAGAVREADLSSSLSGFDNTNGIPRPPIAGGPTCDKSANLYNKTTVRYKGALVSRVQATQWGDWKLFGFTPSEFIPTAWELLPWSFVVDYFTNIGDILTSAVTSAADIAFVNKTVIRNSLYEGSIIPNWKTTKSNLSVTSGEGIGGPAYYSFTRKTVSRSPGTGVPLPTFSLDLGLSSGQLWNLAALLGQASGLHPQNLRRGFTLKGFR